jgi:hypothetical protein
MALLVTLRVALAAMPMMIMLTKLVIICGDCGIVGSSDYNDDKEI